MNMDKPRRDFDLPEEDVEHLDARGLPWETVSEGGSLWLLVHNFPIPDGYNHRIAIAAIQIPSNYANAGLDMVFFHPALARVDGVPIPNADATQMIQNYAFQRWSRHRTTENPWRLGIDNVSTHIGLVEEWLLREFRLRPRR